MYNAVLALVAMIPDDRRSIVYFNKLVFFQTELQFKKYLTKKTPLYFTAFEVLKILVYVLLNYNRKKTSIVKIIIFK